MKGKKVLSQQQLKNLLQEREIGLSAPEVLMELPEGPIFHMLIEGGSRAFEQWGQARALVTLTGLYPVIVDTKDAIPTGYIFGLSQSGVVTTELVHQAEEMDVMQMLAKRLNPPGDESGKTPVEVFSAPDPRPCFPWSDEIMGTWPTDVDPERFDPEDFFEPAECLINPQAQETVSLCFLPVEQSWEVPALLRLGGWNSCPSAVEQVCVHRSWHKRYGAEIVCLSGDTIELFVPDPPTTQLACRKLALEHFAYCDDIVYQGCGSLEDLAAHLLLNRIWYFWWD